jgi:hypothetical protein
LNVLDALAFPQKYFYFSGPKDTEMDNFNSILNIKYMSFIDFLLQYLHQKPKKMKNKYHKQSIISDKNGGSDGVRAIF